MKKENMYSALGGCCIAMASFLLTTDIITAIVVAFLIGAGILFVIYAYK
ncbi:hypothetical protein LCGC14_1610800 [marine sediment metagenome]|uniref:Uncharacterized protein n=1 Tax=marine sediment metagenome TaxID=412755 RepID=A0A0F9L8J1_9ZZZZ